MSYDARKVRLYKVVGGAVVGYSMRVGEARVGLQQDVRTDIAVSAIDITDGYNVESNTNVLSIDPVTGSASFSYRVDPNPGALVKDAIIYPFAPDERWELRYGNALVQQGRIGKVSTHMETSGRLWIRKITYQLIGMASLALASTAEWDFLPQEPALTRLQRWFTVDTAKLTAAQFTYINSEVVMPGQNQGSSTYLDLARDFTTHTSFPVRPSVSGKWDHIEVIPSLTFRGTQPTVLIGNAETWTVGADFSRDLTYATKAETIEVLTDYDAFIAGVETVTVAGSPLGNTSGSFVVGSSRLGGSYQTAIGIQAPAAVVDAFGTHLVVSRIVHAFTPTTYKSALELTPPAVVT